MKFEGPSRLCESAVNRPETRTSNRFFRLNTQPNEAMKQLFYAGVAAGLHARFVAHARAMAPGSLVSLGSGAFIGCDGLALHP